MLTEHRSLIEVIRQPPALNPESSVRKALELLRYGGCDVVPVVDEAGRLKGVVRARDLTSILTSQDDRSVLFEPVSAWMQATNPVVHFGMPLEEVRALLGQSGESALAVVDEENAYVGVVTLHDLLLPGQVRPQPPTIGGMATPWGVYLTSGGLQAGAGNLALVSTGLVLGALMVASYYVIGGIAWGIQAMTGWPLVALWNGPDPARITMASWGALLLKALSLPVFLLLMRALPLARHHAAEHQVVHAVERGEPLVPDVVRRMPRVHPRCGTNIMAAGLVFGFVCEIVSSLGLAWLDPTNGAVLGALAAATTWRSLGAWLQHRFTTKSAGTKHIESGIAAADQLQERYLESGLTHVTLRRRIWCSGMVQVAIGATISSAAGFWLFPFLIQIR